LNSWILIDGATVIDGTGGSAKPDTPVLVKGNRIAAVGAGATADAVPRGEPLEVINAQGKTVMPGLIDAHCHISFGNTRTQEEQDLYTSVELRTLRSAVNAERVLRAGVTGFSQPGGSYYIGVGIRDGIREGIVNGPRVTSAGRFITTSNGISDFYPEPVGVPESSIGVLANKKDDMLAEVRRQIKAGVDLIKLADSPYGDYQAFTSEEMKAIGELVHQLRRRVTIHARGSSEVDASVAAGFDWIMHGNVMTDETIEHLAKAQTLLVPVLLLLANLADWGHLVGTPAAERDGAARLLEKTADTLHRAHRAGVKFGVGTDTGFAVTPYGEWHARELELMMEYAGLSELEVIQAATKNNALVLGLEGEVGEVAAGRLADLLVVNGDPSRDIRILQDKRNLDVIIKDGEIAQFDDRSLVARPFDRAIVYSTGDLTRDLVHGDGQPSSEPALDGLFDGDEGKELAHDLKRRERAAADSAQQQTSLP
jgi:imidazolonepropionase-like amidohydrolase